jgi:RES domain-containing protein
LRFRGRCFRGHDPGWSFSPTSGEGARITGGRFNPPGKAALYLATSIETAIGECMQGFANRMPPLTLCEYDVDCDAIADLNSAERRKAHKVSLKALSCPWKQLHANGEAVPSWKVAAALEADGYAGMLVPSFFVGATEKHVNLVLWDWSDAPPKMVKVHDPSARLPRDRKSWE